MRTMEYKSALTRIEDVDEKGIVAIYPAVMNVKDLGNDIIKSGAFTKTLKENFENIQHYKNHDDNILIGAIQEMKEQGDYLRAVSKLMIKTFDGLNAYEQYKAMAESGKSMKHSIGYWVVKKEEKEDVRILNEIGLMEISTLTKFPMNPKAITESVKSFDQLDLNELLTEEKYYRLLLNAKFTDAKLERIEGLKNYLESLIKTRAAASTPVEIEPIDGSAIIAAIKFNL
jgi:HK97 family phage prohead protease